MNYELLIKNVNEILKQYTMRLTLRQIYYRLVADYGLPNKRSSYNQLSRQLVKARENDEIDEYKIEDRARSTLGGDYGFGSADRFIEHQIDDFAECDQYFSMPMWTNQDTYLEVWVEKDALSRVISEVADDFNVRVAPSKGYSSYTFIKEAVERYEKHEDKDLVLLHYSDHDPSGIDMTRDLQARLNKYTYVDISVQRIALVYDQVKQYQLIPNPTKSADTRSPDYRVNYGDSCWELDAIPPNNLQEIVKKSIQEYIDVDLWNKRVNEIKKNREYVKKKIKEFVDKMR